MASGDTAFGTHSDIPGLEADFEKGEEHALFTVNKYIHHGEDPNLLQDEESGNGWLHYAAKYNFKHVATKLFDHNIDSLARNKDEKTALEVAIDKKFDKMSALIARRMTQSDLQSLFAGVCSNIGSAVESDRISVGSSMDSNNIGSEVESDRNSVVLLMDSIVDSSSEGETKKVNKKIKIKELIESECGFTETLLAVFDSFQTEYVEEDDTVRYNVKLLEEDENGRTPGDQDFDETHHTVFHSLAEREHKEVINHPVVRALVDYKWTEWARNRFMLNVCLYLLGLFSLTFSVAVAATTDDVKTYNTGLQYTRAFFEVISYGTVIRSLILEISQVTKHQLSYCQIRFNCLEMATALILVLVLPVRYINTHLHWYIFGLGYMMWVLKIFKYAVVFSKTDAYIESLRKIFWEDLIPFSLLFCIVNLAFGGTFLLVSKGDDSLETHAETSSLYGIWYVGLRTLIEAQPVVEYTGEEGYRPIGTIVMLAFMSITIVVLLNILIAQISNTYENVQVEAWKSFVVNRASIITRLERNRSHYPFCRNFFKKTRVYTEIIKGKNLKEMVENNMQPMELFKSELTEIRNKLVKNDLNVQTVKTRLHALNKTVGKQLDGIQNTLQSLKEHLETHMSDETHM